MVTGNVDIGGSVVVVGLPEDSCVSSEVLQTIAQHLAVRIPVQEFSNVIISVQQPGEADKGKIWARINGAGQSLGTYVFNNGKWVALSNPPKEIRRFWGDSRTPEAGWEVLSTSNSNLTTGQLDRIKVQWVMDGSNTYYVYYDAVFIGI